MVCDAHRDMLRWAALILREPLFRRIDRLRIDFRTDHLVDGALAIGALRVVRSQVRRVEEGAIVEYSETTL